MKKIIITITAILTCAALLAAAEEKPLSVPVLVMGAPQPITIGGSGSSTLSGGSTLIQHHVNSSTSGNANISGDSLSSGSGSSTTSGSSVNTKYLDASGSDMIHIEAVAKKGKINVLNYNFSAEGGIRLVYKDIKIQADSIQKVPGQPIINAEGHVIFEQGKNVVQADSLTVNLETEKATINNAESYNSKMFFGGKTLQANYPDSAELDNAYFTTDYDIQDPTYHFAAQSMTVQPSSKIVAKNVTFYAGKYPILWFPYYATSLNQTDGRNSLFPQVGNSTQYGNYLLWGVDYKSLPYNWFTGYVDLRYSSLLGWLFTVDNTMKFSDVSNGEISASDVNIPNGNHPAQWNFQAKYHDESDTGEDFSNQLFQAKKWDFFYQNESMNLLLDPNGVPIPQSNYYSINQQNLWKLQLKGQEQIGSDAVLKADVSQSVQSVVQQLSQPQQGSVQNNLPNNQNVQLWTKINYTKNNSLYKYYLNIDNEANLNTQIVGIGFTHKNNFQTYFDQKIAKVKINFTSINQDKLEVNPLNPTVNRIDDPQILNQTTYVNFGNYSLGKSNYYIGTQVGNVDNHDTINKYNADGSFTQYNLIDQHNYLGLTFGNKTIPAGPLGSVNWNSQNDYKDYANPTVSGAATIGGANLNNGMLDNKVTLTTPLYSNLKNKHRAVDLTVTNVIPTEYRRSYGAAPNDLLQYNMQNNEFSTLAGAGEKVILGVGNITFSNGIQRLNYYPFQQNWLSEKTTEFISTSKMNDTKLTFDVKHSTQYDPWQLPSQQNDNYTLTYNSNAYEMYQYSYSNENDFNQNPTQGALNTLVASNNVLDYNYTNGMYALDYKNVDLFGVNQTVTPLSTVTTNQLNHYWTAVYDDQNNQEYSKYVKVTYGYGYNYLVDDPQATSTVVTLGFIDKSDGFKGTSSNDSGSDDIGESKGNGNSLFDDKKETNALINSNNNVSGNFNLMDVGETYQQDLVQSDPTTKYKSYTLQLSTSRDMQYAYSNSFNVQNWVNSYQNYALNFDMKLEQYFEYNPFVTLTRPNLTGSAAAMPSQAEIGQNITFQMGPTDYGYWLTFMTAYDWAPNPNNPSERIGWSDLGVGIRKRVRAVDWTFSVEKQWNYNTNQFGDVITLAVSINAFPGKGIGYAQNGPNRGFAAGL